MLWRALGSKQAPGDVKASILTSVALPLEGCPDLRVSELADRDFRAFITYYSQVELVDTQLAEKQAKGGTENAAVNFAPRRRMTKKRPGDHQLQMAA